MESDDGECAHTLQKLNREPKIWAWKAYFPTIDNGGARR